MTLKKIEKTVLITGGANGLGKAIAAKLALGSHAVAIADKDAAKDIPHPFLKADVSKAQDVAQLYDWCKKSFGIPDVLILNAGVGLKEKLAEGDPEKWQHVFDVNVMGSLRVLRAFLPEMLARKKGHILFVSSVSEGQFHEYGGVYCASKSALGILVETLRIETAPHLCVSSLLPGAANTSFFENQLSGAQSKPPEAELLSAEDLAEDVLYILSRSSHCINKMITRPITQIF